MKKMSFFDYHLHIARLPDGIWRVLHRRGYRFNSVACEPWEWSRTEELLADCRGGQLKSTDSELKNAGFELKNAGFELNCADFEGCGFAFGIHPMAASKVSDGDLRRLRELLMRRPDAAVGETGLDKRFEGYEPGGIQERLFRVQVGFAVEFGRDLQIHCVGDYARMLAILEECGYGKGPGRPVLHRFGGDRSVVKRALGLNALFSIHPSSANKKSTLQAISEIPSSHIVFETDADESTVTAIAANMVEGTARNMSAPSPTAENVADYMEFLLENVQSRFRPNL